MKILLSHNFYRSGAPSGEDIVFLNEKKMLEDRGHEVITYIRYSDEINNYSIMQKARLISDTTWSSESYNDVTALILEHKPDVAHFHNTFPLISPSVYSACREAAVPVVQTLHNYRLVCPGALLYRDGNICKDCVGRGVYRSIFRKCYRHSMTATAVVVKMLNANRAKNTYVELVDRYIAPSKFLADIMIDGGIPEDMIQVKPHFVYDPPDANYDKSNYIVYVGRLSAEKGIKTLISACKCVPDIKVIVLGDGVLKNEIVEITRRHNLNVEFIGFVNREVVYEYLKNAKALVMPSECFEVFGLSVIESLAAGTPVIASDIGGLGELIHDGINGYTYSPGDAKRLSQLMEMLVTDKSKKLQVSARKDFDDKYTAAMNIESLENIYIELLGVNAIKEGLSYVTS